MNKVAADLMIQAMLFDMAIDWETLQLVPKVEELPAWQKRWNEKRSEADFDEYIDVDRD